MAHSKEAKSKCNEEASSANFMRDVAPYFLASYAFVVSHVVYQMTGNLLVPIWLAYIFNLSSFWRKDYVETNLDLNQDRIWSKDKRFMLPLYSFAFVDTVNWLWCLCLVANLNPARDTCLEFLFENRHGDGLGNWLVFTFVWGYMAGLNGLAGHELIHKREQINKLVGLSTYTKIFYSHFVLEHSSGHHRNIGTNEDPVSARQGQTFYEFFPQAVYGSLLKTHEREMERINIEYAEKCKQEDSLNTKAPLLIILTENRVVQSFALHLGILAVIYHVFGPKAVLFQLGYSYVGIFFIELINYVEHYGLRRHKDSRGIYEPITEKHSWNSTSSTLLFRIQRHSDHHMHAYRPYQILRKFENAPELPFDYLFSLLLALCPSAWFAVMDPLVEKFAHKNSQGGQGEEGQNKAQAKQNTQPAFTFFLAFYAATTFLVFINF